MAELKTIDVRDQVSLSLKKLFRFCLKGISYRLFRSTLTLAVVVVAVAFFTVLLSEGMMVRSTALGVTREMMSAREGDRLLMHVFHNYSSLELSAKLAGMSGNQEAISELAKITGEPEKTIEDVVAQCLVEQRVLIFMRELSAGKRVVLVKKYSGRGIFRFLRSEGEWQGFVDALGNMRSVRLPVEVAVFKTFLDHYEKYLADLERVRQARWKAVSALQGRLKSLSGAEETALWLGEAPYQEVDRWRQAVAAAGFNLDKEKMGRIRSILRVTALEERISQLLQSPEKRKLWKEELQTTPGLEDKILMLEDAKVAGVILEGKFSPEDRAAVSGRFTRMRHLRELLRTLPPAVGPLGDPLGFMDGRQLFLVIISFLVCMVGVTNAMLMSITERFREIATMKCLGATDGFILKQFLIEAAIQGLTGGTLGMMIGMVISVVKSAIMLGSMVFTHFPGGQMVICALVTVVAGVLLAMLASIYPARAAATMAPMDAMRVE